MVDKDLVSYEINIGNVFCDFCPWSQEFLVKIEKGR